MPFVAVVVAAPLAVVLGTVGCFVKGLLGPARLGESEWTQRRRFLCYLLVFLAVTGVGAALVVPDWGMQTDEERDFILSALCADGKGCPLVGNEMNQLRIKLGPLNRYFMTLGQLVTPDPRFTLWAILTLHALAAAWLAAAGDRLLGFPFGIVAGLSFGTNGVLLDVITGASNGSWASVFQVGAIAGTLQWMRGEPRGLVVAVTCLAAACQLHGTNLIFVPPFLFAAAYWRPPMPRRTVLLCLIIVVALYSSWLVYQWQTGLSDFSLISASWMVSQAPPLLHRVARGVEPLGGILAPFALWGAVVLVTGRGTASSELAGGRSIVLFLVLPLAATLLSGGNWSSRYGAPMVAPAGLAAAAGLRRLATLLSADRQRQGLYGLAIAGVGLALVAGMSLSGGLLRSEQELVSRSRAALTLAEQIEAIRILGQHGYGAADLESRVHGSAWNRWDGGHIYLGDWLIGATSHAKEGEHVVIVECDAAPADFASWQARLATPRRMPHLLVGYDAQLAPATVAFSGRDGVFWTSNRAAPFYSGMVHGGDAEMRISFDPRLAYPPEFIDLQARWPGDQPIEMRLTTTLAPGPDDRFLVLSHDTDLTATVTLDGVPRHSLEPAMPLGESVRRRYLVTAGERSSQVDILVSIDLPAGAPVPRRVDFYEEPPCAAQAPGRK